MTGVSSCWWPFAAATAITSVVAGCGQIGTATFTPFDVAAAMVRPEPERFSVGASAFSPDSKFPFLSYSDTSDDSDGTAKLDLTTFAITGMAPGFCGEGIHQVSFSPDGAHMVGLGKLVSGGKDVLFSRANATGELTTVSDFAPLAYLFSRDGRLLYLVQQTWPAESTYRSPTAGTFVRAYDLQAKTYVDPQTLKPVSAPWSGQLLLKPHSPDNLRLFGRGSFGVAPDGRHILFFAALYSSHPSLADVQAIFAARKQRIGIHDLFLLRFDVGSQTISADPLNLALLSNSEFSSLSSLPRISTGRIKPDGDVHFSVQGIPKVFLFENGSISTVEDLSQTTGFKGGFALSPDRRWVAYTYDGPHDSSRGYNHELALFDADKNAVALTVSKKTMRKNICSSKTAS